jgi:hypothetical protein
MALCDFFHHCVEPKVLRDHLRLDLIRPVPVNHTPRLPDHELQRSPDA